jgi:uncharacterized protein
MPVAPTYPGVYIEEIPSGVRTITGVATSITAFIGRALRGPVNVATTINSFGDFERIFGGLWVDSSLGYAVRDFYLNGGSQAIIVRLFHAAEEGTPKSKVTAGGLTLEAAYEGTWGSNLRAIVDTDVSKDVAERMKLEVGDLFNLTVRDAGPSGITERFLNVSYKNSSRRIDHVLESESRLVRWDPAVPIDPDNPPAITEDSDAATKAEDALAELRRKVPPATEDEIKAAEDALRAAIEAMGGDDGISLTKVDDFTPKDAETNKLGLYALEQVYARDGLFNILCIPPYFVSDTENVDMEVALVAEAATYCEKRRAMLLVDPPKDWIDKDNSCYQIYRYHR